ncbi:putative Dystrophin-like protein 1 [Hypsibius exemplaris]|uniref:Dystrophin-like protein 1 n=1 Tax=Hypsibius exemplaris TaxID=2072580 RepID=A0A1W0W8F0_HYPEX|nr:putative Dystrophin-like protein 1 [Hypsibius exemplaris]
MRPDRLILDMENSLTDMTASNDPATLIANRNRASGRFGSKRIFSMFFPRSNQLLPATNHGVTSKDPVTGEETVTYSADAFQHGISFEAKLIGVLEIPRPQSRMEIVAAMRRVRYEHKTKGIGKRKVDLKISVDGVRVCSHDGGRNRLAFGRVEYDKLDNLISLEAEPITILNHPVHRIFYVSHDSQDLNVFSYIVRENLNDNLRCIVFKARRKAEAMQIVKTIGQAFDVCHQLQQQRESRPKLMGPTAQASPGKPNYPSNILNNSTTGTGRTGTVLPLPPTTATMTGMLPLSDSQNSLHASSTSSAVEELLPSTSSILPANGNRHSGTCPNIQRIKKSLSELNPTCRNGLPHTLTGSITTSHVTGAITSRSFATATDPFSVSRISGVSSSLLPLEGIARQQSASHSCLTVINARLDHEIQKSRVAKSQIAFLKNQVASETAARVDAQNRIDELLRQNAMLLDVIEGLLAPEDSPTSTSKANAKESLSRLRSGTGYATNGSLTQARGAARGSTSTGSSTEGQIGHTSSPDSGVKSAFSYHLNDDETY